MRKWWWRWRLSKWEALAVARLVSLNEWTQTPYGELGGGNESRMGSTLRRRLTKANHKVAYYRHRLGAPTMRMIEGAPQKRKAG